MNFKDEHQISVMLNRTIKGKVPPGYSWARYHTGFVQETMSPYALAANVYRGWAFCPVYNGTRKQVNFSEAWHIAFDCDESALADVRALPWVDDFSSFGYTTPSHTDDAPRCRVVFVFDQPITDGDHYRQLYFALAWRFQVDGIETDPSCKDLLRVYFGSPRCAVWPNWSVLPGPAQAEFIRQWRLAVPPEVKPQAHTVRAAPPDSLPAGLLQNKARELLDNLRQCPDGEKHYTLRKIAYTFGGYVASGYYAQSDVLGWMADAILPRAADARLAERTALECLIAGKSAPLVFEAPAPPQPVRKTSNGVDLRTRL